MIPSLASSTLTTLLSIDTGGDIGQKPLIEGTITVMDNREYWISTWYLIVLMALIVITANFGKWEEILSVSHSGPSSVQ